MNRKYLCFFLIGLFFFASCGKKGDTTMTETINIIADFKPVDDVKKQDASLAPVEIAFDDSQLDENEKKALQLLVKAAKYMDDIFLKQVYSKNEALAKELREGKHPDYSALYNYFKVNFGPFDRLDEDLPFINTKELKPKGANFYPEDITKEEFEKWLTDHPQDKAAFTSNFTIIRREEGKLKAIPYSQAYADHLKPAADLLKQAAELIENKSLKTYLNSRADALSSNDYFQSDMDWVDLKDHNIEIVIGPYEVYEDALFGYKAAFECFITLVDKEESKKLSALAGYLDEMEKHLPYDDKYRNFKRGASSPVIIANEVFTAGDTKAGVQTTAFNLPNDERVREAKGSKKVMLKNVARAKFDKCWIPIVNTVLAESDLPYISFDSYYNHVLMHEVAHGLGPGIIEKNGKKTTVNQELKDLYSVIEETKADILGLWNLGFMVDKGFFPKELKGKMHVSHLGGIFRSVRFGTHSAHGGANLIQLNYIMDKGGFQYNEETARFSVNRDKVNEAVKALSHEVLMIEALGDYERAKALVDKYRVVTPALEKALDMLKAVPIDIKPVFAIEKEILN